MTDDTILSPMAKQILTIVTRYRHVSFAELERRVDGFSGDQGMFVEPWNIVLWPCLSREAFDALKELQDQKLIVADPTSTLTYFIDGMVPNLPIVKAKRRYKKPHWAPVVLNPTEAGEKFGEDHATAMRAIAAEYAGERTR
jgi:hypothetical protein